MNEAKTSSRHKKNNKLRWLATDINLNFYILGVLSLMARPVAWFERLEGGHFRAEGANGDGGSQKNL